MFMGAVVYDKKLINEGGKGVKLPSLKSGGNGTAPTSQAAELYNK